MTRGSINWGAVVKSAGSGAPLSFLLYVTAMGRHFLRNITATSSSFPETIDIFYTYEKLKNG
jgi:hypothetical protein